MSGFGMFEQYAAGLELAERGERFREDAFLQQLSRNGAMMLAANHDELWRECMQEVLGQPPGASWEWMAQLLRTMPAYQARQRLWRASYLWWMNSQRHRLHILAGALLNGTMRQLSERAPLHAFAEDLALRGGQLEQLSWCLNDTETTTIPVVDEPSTTASKRSAKRSK